MKVLKKVEVQGCVCSMLDSEDILIYSPNVKGLFDR